MFLFSHWRKLPLATRMAIATNFGIIKKGSTEVFNNEIKSDGYVIEEVEAALNVDALQKFLSAGDTDMKILWDKMVARIEGREYVPTESTNVVVPILTTEPIAATTETPVIPPVSTEAPVAAAIEVPVPKKRGRPAKVK